ncbi:MAG: sulfurtransferase complex subunit TusC [Pseudohongiellaceae bacterium]|nr:sulfurtransferase complex subunit TusC [Pseudohongiellaceae bacterium]
MSEPHIKTISFISRKAPHSQGLAKACLDMVLSNAVFEQNINFIFMGDGVYQLKDQQAPKLIDNKDLSAAFSALPLYDVHNIYVEADALPKRYMTAEDLVVEAKSISNEQIAQLLADSDVVYAL